MFRRTLGTVRSRVAITLFDVAPEWVSSVYRALPPAAQARLRRARDAAPKVSAIVSTYKSAGFMRGCLEDLIGQTLYRRGDLEIIVIDSGSPENEGEIVREFQTAHPDIRYHRTEHETLHASWNRGIELATGDYLTTANADDRHRTDALEILASRLDRKPHVGAVYADVLVTRRPHETFARNSAAEAYRWPDYSFEELRRHNILGPQPMWRRSLHERWGLFDAALYNAGDYDFWLRIGRTEGIEHVPKALGLYYYNPAGLENSHKQRTQAEALAVQRRYDPVMPRASKHFAVSAPQDRAADAGVPAAAIDAPLVSVVVPTFNRPELLARALESIARQTFRRFEVIVVNDGGAPVDDVLAHFQSRLRIIALFHSGNRGLAAARNTGIAAAQGKYVAYLDDDDWYRADHIETLIHAVADQSTKVVHSNATQWLEEETPDGFQPVRPWWFRWRSLDVDRLMVSNYIAIPTVLHERDCLRATGGFDESFRTHEDWEFLIRLSRFFAVKHVPKITVDLSLRQPGSSLSNSNGGVVDLWRTMVIVHERYRPWVEHRPDIIAKQERARARYRRYAREAASR